MTNVASALVFVCPNISISDRLHHMGLKWKERDDEEEIEAIREYQH